MTGFIIGLGSAAFALGEPFIEEISKLRVPDKYNPRPILKVGGVAITKQRPDGITYADWAVNRARAHRLKVFWDGKESDISNTVRDTVLNIAEKDTVCMATFMASMSSKALREAAIICRQRNILSLGVTALTDMDIDDCKEVFGADTINDAVYRLANRAYRHVLGGIVCSGQELLMLYEHGLGTDLERVVTGIRSDNLPPVENDDQERPMSPAEAVRRAASYIVVERQVTTHVNPIAAALTIIDEMAAAA